MFRSALWAFLFCATAVNAGKTGGFADQNGGTTGGAGGKSVTCRTGTEINKAICGRGSKDTPLTIYVSGTITLGNTKKQSGSCNTANDRIDLKGIKNISIIGKGRAVFDQIGIRVSQSSNVIIQNVHVKNVKKSNGATSNGGDAIGMEKNVKNVWVDHCTLEASGGESAGYDGLCDMKAGTKYVTVSYTIFKNSGRGGLVGSSDGDTGNGPVTFHHNFYSNIDSRTPLLRSATAHAYNNYYSRINKSGLNPRNGGKVKVEGCVFENAKNPLGTFYTSKKGSWDVKDNIFQSVKWTSKDSPAGPNVKSTTSVRIPYSYRADKASCTKNVVKSTAGSGKGLKRSDGSCKASSSPSPSPSAPDYTPPSSPPEKKDKNNAPAKKGKNDKKKKDKSPKKKDNKKKDKKKKDKKKKDKKKKDKKKKDKKKKDKKKKDKKKKDKKKK